MIGALQSDLEASQMVCEVQFELLLVHKSLVESDSGAQPATLLIVHVITPGSGYGVSVKSVEGAELPILNVDEVTPHGELCADHRIKGVKGIVQVVAEELFRLIVVRHPLQLHFLLLFGIHLIFGVTRVPLLFRRQLEALVLLASGNRRSISPGITVDPLMYLLLVKNRKVVHRHKFMRHIEVVKVVFNLV